jgi:hypothetical protein
MEWSLTSPHPIQPAPVLTTATYSPVCVFEWLCENTVWTPWRSARMGLGLTLKGAGLRRATIQNTQCRACKCVSVCVHVFGGCVCVSVEGWRVDRGVSKRKRRMRMRGRHKFSLLLLHSQTWLTGKPWLTKSHHRHIWLTDHGDVFTPTVAKSQANPA